jgi:hypothetical protein
MRSAAAPARVRGLRRAICSAKIHFVIIAREGASRVSCASAQALRVDGMASARIDADQTRSA